MRFKVKHTGREDRIKTAQCPVERIGMASTKNGMGTVRRAGRVVVALLTAGAASAGAAQPAHDHGSSSMVHSHGGSNASAELVATSGSQVGGMLHLTQHDNSNVLIQGRVTGLTPGLHGFHIHVNGNCDSPDGMSAGGHYAPAGGRHGAPSSKDHHLGDLGNIEADRSGVANVSVDVQGVSLALIGLNSIVDRAVVIHAGADDFSDPAGNSGARVACGVIEQDMDMRM